MDLRTLNYFVVVAEELNITRAAEILNMSQPPLSYQMKSLEEELGTTLFIRGKRQLKLTQSGELLYRKAKDILALSDKTKAEILSLNKGISGTISIGLVEGMASNIASNWIADFMKQNPNIHFRILSGNSDDLIEKMRAGLISLAVISSPIDEILLNSFKIGNEQMVAFLSNENPLSKLEKDYIDINDLVDQPLIVPSRKADINVIRKWFKKNNLEPNIVTEIDSNIDAASLVAKNVGISISAKSTYKINESIVLKEIKGEEYKIDYLFVWRKGHNLTTFEEMFIDFVKAIYIKN